MTDPIKHEDWLSQLRERFGPDPLAWAFVCPSCGDVATGADFKAALAEHPRQRRDGSAATASDYLGQQCIGRVLGALADKADRWTGRGCDWCAFGLFCGPVTIEADDGHRMHAFRMAEPVSA